MEIFFAWTLPAIAVIVLVQALLRMRSPIGQAVAVYAAFSVVFGCAHFLYYRHSPSSYIVSKDVPVTAAAKAAVDIQQLLESDLMQ